MSGETPINFAQQLQSLLTTSTRWASFAKAQGSRFDTAAKVNQGLRFATGPEREHLLGNHFPISFVVPSCLRGVSHHQSVIERLLDGYHQGRRLHAENRGGRVMLFAEGMPQIGEPKGRFLLGFLKAKHERWVLPLLATGHLRFFLSHITGEQYRAHHPHSTLGVNILIADIDLALGALSASLSETEERPVLAVAA